MVEIEFYVQYNQHIYSVRISRRSHVGTLYQRILALLEISSRQVVYMIHNGQALGLPPKEFTQTLTNIGIHSGSMIFVILNHYPDLVTWSVPTTHRFYQQWLNAHTHHHEVIRSEDVIFDQILTHNYVPPPTPIPAPRHHTDPLMPSDPENQEDDGADGGDNDGTGEIVDEHDNGDPNPDTNLNPLIHPISTDTEASQLHGVDLLLNVTQQFDQDLQQFAPQDIQTAFLSLMRGTNSNSTPASPTLSNIMQTLNQSMDSFSQTIVNEHLTSPDIINFLITYQNHGHLTDVPVNLTQQQINRLKHTKYHLIKMTYCDEHHGEQPYDHCPITREPFRDDSDVIVLPCGHYFSTEGLQPWLSQHSIRCPCCNQDVRDQETRDQDANPNSEN